MTVLVKTLSDLVVLFLQALRFDMLLPSLILVGLNITFVLPRLRQAPIFQHLNLVYFDVSASVIAGLIVLLIAYILNVLNGVIIRFFEGYPFLATKVGRLLRDANQDYVDTLKQNYSALVQELEQYPVNSPERAWAEYRANGYLHELNYMYPRFEPHRFLPTRLGNILASAEQYPSVLYGIDAVATWPFLVPILQKSGYISVVASEKSMMDFLLNMSAITLTFGLELVYLELLTAPLLTHFWLTIFVELVGAFLIAYLFYSLAISGALGWGHSIRVAFVMHKEILRRSMGLKKPKKVTDDKKLWEQAGLFFRDQESYIASSIFEYPIPAELQTELLGK